MLTKIPSQRVEKDASQPQTKQQMTHPNNAQAHQLRSYQLMAQQAASTIQLKAVQSLMGLTTLQRVEEDDLQTQLNPVQRVEEEEPAQAKLVTVQKVEDEESLQAKSTNSGLPHQLKNGIESLSGMRMDHVKVNYNSDKPAQLNAHAYAQGSEIHIAPGQEQHLPHEAWHVVQQAQGRVQPTMQMKTGVPINDDAGLESEADVMGAKAIAQRHETAQVNNVNRNDQPQLSSSGPLQRMVDTDLRLGTEVWVTGLNSQKYRCYISARYNETSQKYKVQVLEVGETIRLVDILELTPAQITLPTIIEQPLFSSVEEDSDEVFIFNSAETDDSDHGAESDAGEEEKLIDWNEISDQGLQRSIQITTQSGAPLLFNIFLQLVAFHCNKAGMEMPDKLPARYGAWLSGVKTRAQFKKIIGLTPGFGDDVKEIIQLARTPNTYSYNTDYTGNSNGFEYKNVVYYLDGDGNIDFKKNPSTIINAYNNATGNKVKSSSIKWKYPVKDASEVQMSNDLKDKEQGIMPSGKKIKLKTGSRGQHFAIADMLYSNARSGTWTWHHLTPHYKMVLVDMKVHAKHGHNGGVHIWNK
nr:DUF4157 domain-containing protein [uncultured Undibacterium sp.]